MLGFYVFFWESFGSKPKSSIIGSIQSSMSMREGAEIVQIYDWASMVASGTFPEALCCCKTPKNVSGERRHWSSPNSEQKPDISQFLRLFVNIRQSIVVVCPSLSTSATTEFSTLKQWPEKRETSAGTVNGKSGSRWRKKPVCCMHCSRYFGTYSPKNIPISFICLAHRILIAVSRHSAKDQVLGVWKKRTQNTCFWF